jgi:hypothetical protein
MTAARIDSIQNRRRSSVFAQQLPLSVRRVVVTLRNIGTRPGLAGTIGSASNVRIN